MNNWVFVGAAFTVTWIAVLGYAAHLHRAMRHAREAMVHAARSETR
jgi:CcmD family protein